MTAAHRSASRAIVSTLTALAVILGVGFAATETAQAKLPTPRDFNIQIPVPDGSAIPGVLDRFGRPTAEAESALRELASKDYMPEEAASLLEKGLDFLTGAGNGGPEMPSADEAPDFAQFIWPTVAGKCINNESNAFGTAIAVPGPAEIPLPGAAAGQTVFLFTALGTAPAATEGHGMKVRWINLETLAYGETPLTYHGINPEGPATVSGVADTGTGAILAVVEGTVTTEKESCNYYPTVAFFRA